MTRIAVDAMGSDNYPTPDVEGAALAAREYGVEILLVGDAAKIQPVLDSVGGANLPIRVVNAPEMLTMHNKGEDLVMKARHKEAQNSMAVGLDLVKNGEADAFVTAGNTVMKVAGSGDFWWSEWRVTYPNDEVYFAVTLAELRDGLVYRETTYWAAPFEAPAWRAPAAEPKPTASQPTNQPGLAVIGGDSASN